MIWISIHLPRRRRTDDEILERDNAWYAESIRHSPNPIVMGSKHKPEPWTPKKHLRNKKAGM